MLIGAQRPREPAPEVAIARAGTPADPRAVTVIMRDYRFDPTPVVLVPGETVSMTIFNGGLVEHELTLGGRGRPGGLGEADAAATPPACSPLRHPRASRPGPAASASCSGRASSEVAYRVPQVGGPVLVCHLPGTSSGA